MQRISPRSTASIIAGWCLPTFSGNGDPDLLEELVGLGVIPVPASDHLVRQGPHVAAALHVVLAAQRVQAATVLADVAGQKPQPDEREHTIGAIVVLGDAQGPVEDGLIRRGVHTGDLADIIGRDARDLLSVLQRVAGDLSFVLLEVFRGPLDELLVVEVFGDDHVSHRVRQGDVRAHVEAEPLVGFLYLIYLSRVHHDHLRAVLYAAAHVVVDDGVALHGVRSPADYEVGVLELLVRGGCSARSERCHQTGDAGGVSSTVTRVYVAVPEHLPDELPCQVVELVGRARGAEGPEGVGTMLLFDLAHLARDQVQRFVPGRRNELAVLADEGTCDPPVAVQMAPALTSLDARLALAGRVLLLARHLLDDAVLDLEGQAATHTAETADRGHFPRAVGLAVLRYLLYSRRHAAHPFSNRVPVAPDSNFHSRDCLDGGFRTLRGVVVLFA